MNNIDYRHLYNSKYRTIPNLWFNIIFWSSTVITLIGGVLVFVSEGSALGAFLILVGILINWLVASLIQHIIAVSISQKIVVADTLQNIEQKLLSMNSPADMGGMNNNMGAAPYVSNPPYNPNYPNIRKAGSACTEHPPIPSCSQLGHGKRRGKSAQFPIREKESSERMALFSVMSATLRHPEWSGVAAESNAERDIVQQCRDLGLYASTPLCLE